MPSLDYLKAFIKDRRVGAITATSQHTIRRILHEVEPNCEYIVEYGACEGTITRELLNKIPPSGKIYAVDTNEQLIAKLSALKDPRLTVIKDDIGNVSSLLNTLAAPRIDLVISGIPLSSRKSNRDVIIENTYRGLCSRGKFVAYQYSCLLLPVIKQWFPITRWCCEKRNFPPLFIMIGQK